MSDNDKRTPEELKKIAQGIYERKIFTDRHLREYDSIELVFMPFALMEKDDVIRFAKKVGDGGMIFEWIDKAGPTSINGLPCFFSFSLLDTEEAETVVQLVEKISQAIAAIT